MSTPTDAAATPARTRAGRRRLGLLVVLAVCLVAALAAGWYWQTYARHYESTDNAYVHGPVVQITPQLAGTVTAVLADDTDRVRAGQVLVRLDATDAAIALEQAQASLAQRVREVAAVYANNASLRAQIALRDSEIATARLEIERAQADHDRRRSLLGSGAVSDEEIAHARAAIDRATTALATSRAAVAAAREDLQANLVRTQGIDVGQHPSVLQAAAQVRDALQALRRTELAAPVSGTVARRNVQVGQRVQAGAPLMAVVPLEKVWIEANFKEVQLRDVRVGQAVEVTADLYGRRIEYRGRVAGLGAGTGAAFALLPAQNATGNWIKVVQRLPVRVELEPTQLAEHPLRIGLSMRARVDLRSAPGGPALLPPSQARPDAAPAPAGGGGAGGPDAAVPSDPLVTSATGGPIDAAADAQARALIDDIVARQLARGR